MSVAGSVTASLHAAARTEILLTCLALAGDTGCRREETQPEPAPQASVGDPYHPAPRDTLDRRTYEGWKRFRLDCDRCHGEDAEGTSFGPSLLDALKPTGAVPTRAAFDSLLTQGRPDKGMPNAEKLGLAPEQFEGIYDYLVGRSSGLYHGGRPAVRDSP